MKGNSNRKSQAQATAKMCRDWRTSAPPALNKTGGTEMTYLFKKTPPFGE